MNMLQPGQYHFHTRWLVHAPVSAVYELIHNAEAWPLWWPSVRTVNAYTDQDGAEIQEQHWRTPFGYSFSFNLRLLARRPNELLAAEASGMLAGTGIWRFEEKEQGCLVSFEWKVRTRVAWMNRTGWLLRPVFALNHRLVMEQGRRGLERMVGGRVEGLRG